VIRKIDPGDAESFLNMLKQLDAETEFMLYEPGERTTSVEEMKLKIDNTLKSGSLLLIEEENSKIEGFLSADKGFANRIIHSAYIVIGVLKGCAGKGIGTELFKELGKWASENNITRLELTVMAHNDKAINLYKKMGFKIEGLKEKSLIVDGKYVDEYYMGKIL
jgi:RimJ/RimL family protein N-acetyltransferase